jgi:uncharacterized protein YacL
VSATAVGLAILVAGLCAFVGGYVGAAMMLRRQEGRGGGAPPRPGAPAAGAPAPKLLDTSVIIDGRLAEVCDTGFLEGRLLVPGFVLAELRQVAEAGDPLKRARGKRGFDVLQRLRADRRVAVEVVEGDPPGVAGVDDKLIALAKTLGARLVTTDHILEHLAEARGVPVLNVNALALALKPPVLAGEVMHVQVLKEGREPGQGVAYLADGTMVVVDGGRKYLGRDVEVTVTSVLQTAAGRMIFTRPREPRRVEGAAHA